MLRLCVSLALLSMGTSIEQDVCVAGQKCDGAAQLDDGMNLIQQLSTKSMDASDAKTQRVMAGIKASALESQIREWAVKAAAGEHVPDDIIKLVEAVLANLEKIKEGTQKEHSTDVDLLNKLTTRMGECGSSASKAQTDADGINELARTSEANRQTHAQCRADEGKALDSKTTACDAFELFSSRLKTDSPKLECAADLAEKDEANMLKCMEALEDWTSSYSTTDYRAKKNDCEAKTATHTNKKKTCDDAQDTFELGFCRHEALLTATCSEQTSCRETMGAEKDEVCGAVQSNANVRKTEYSSIERAKCYVEVLKIDGKADAKTAKVNECDKMEINVSGLEVTCPEMQAATACDVTVVADKPGDVDFLTKEYTDQDWHGKAPTETCTPCPDTKLAECPAEDATTVNFNGYNYRTISGKAKTDTNAGCENSWTSMPVGYEFATYSDDIQKNVVSKYRWGFHIMMYGDTWTPERQEVYPTGIDPSGVKQVHSGYGMLHDVATDRYKVSACSWGILVQKKCKPQATKATAAPVVATGNLPLPEGFKASCEHSSEWTYLLDYHDAPSSDDLPDDPSAIAAGFHNDHAFFLGIEKIKPLNIESMQLCFGVASDCHEICDDVNPEDDTQPCGEDLGSPLKNFVTFMSGACTGKSQHIKARACGKPGGVSCDTNPDMIIQVPMGESTWHCHGYGVTMDIDQSHHGVDHGQELGWYRGNENPCGDGSTRPLWDSMRIRVKLKA